MTLKVRRILSLIFILLFFLITPAIVLYSAGFKLSKNGFFIQKTGMFILDSSPKGAKILLNGQARKTLINSWFNKNSFISTPAKIKNLLPGEYDLAFELDGYSGWRKKLTIQPGASTLSGNVYLFKNGPPELIAPAEAESISLSPAGNRALILSAEQITFLNLANETKKSLSRGGLKAENIVWSDDGQKLIIDNWLYDLNDLAAKIDLHGFAGGFNYKLRNGVLYFQDKNSLYQLNGGNLPKKIAGDIQFNDYLIKGGYLYLIVNAKPAADILKIIDLASGQQVKSIELPALAEYSFINPKQAWLNLYDHSHKILYLIDPAAGYYSPLAETINNVQTAFWQDDNNLLYANDFEIWLYDLKTKNKTLITRIGDTINRAVMPADKNFLIYATKQTINAIELDDRQKRNLTELVKFDAIDALALSPRGDKIYFSGKIGSQSGLYRFSIQ